MRPPHNETCTGSSRPGLAGRLASPGQGTGVTLYSDPEKHAGAPRTGRGPKAFARSVNGSFPRRRFPFPSEAQRPASPISAVHPAAAPAGGNALSPYTQKRVLYGALFKTPVTPASAKTALKEEESQAILASLSGAAENMARSRRPHSQFRDLAGFPGAWPSCWLFQAERPRSSSGAVRVGRLIGPLICKALISRGPSSTPPRKRQGRREEPGR